MEWENCWYYISYLIIYTASSGITAFVFDFPLGKSYLNIYSETALQHNFMNS